MPKFPWRRGNLPIIVQSEAAECGLACIAMIAGFHGHRTDLTQLRVAHQISLRGMTLRSLMQSATLLHLESRAIRLELDELAFTRQPCILHWDFQHFVVLKSVRCSENGIVNEAIIHDPAVGARRVLRDELSRSFTGIAVELAPGPAFARGDFRRRLDGGMLLSPLLRLRLALLQVFIVTLVIEMLTFGPPLLTQLVVDGPIRTHDLPDLLTLAAGFSLVMVCQVLSGFGRAMAVLYLSARLRLETVGALFTHLINLPISFFEKRHIGDIVSRFNSVFIIQNTLSVQFFEALIDGMVALATLAILFVYSPLLSCAVLLTITAYACMKVFWYRQQWQATEEYLVAQSSEQSAFIESVRGIQAIKLFGKEADRRGRWLGLASSAQHKAISAKKLELLTFHTAALLKGGEAVVVTCLGAWLVTTEQMTTGMFFAYLAFRMTFSSRAFALVDKVAELASLGLPVSRIADIVKTEEEQTFLVEFHSKAPLQHIELRNISFRYAPNDPWVLQDVCLSIQAGEFLAITGASGSGKTTLIKILLGIVLPTQGELLVNGVPVHEFGLRNYRRLIGTVMQDDHLFAGTIADNISFFATEADEAHMRQCAELAGIAGDIEQMPMAYLTLIGEMGSTLSGGQRQRIILARALYKQPQILLLDEATSHLDTATERRVVSALRKLGIAQISVAHRSEAIASADRVVEMRDGRILAQADATVCTLV